MKLSNILDDLNKLQNLLGLTYNFHDLTVKDEDMKNIMGLFDSRSLGNMDHNLSDPSLIGPLGVMILVAQEAPIE